MGNGRIFNGLLRKPAKPSQIVYIWLNKISSRGEIGSTCMGPLASEIFFAEKQNYITFKNRSCTC